MAEREFMTSQEIRATPEGGKRLEEFFVQDSNGNPYKGWSWVRLRYWTNAERDEYEGKSIRIKGRKSEFKYDLLRARAVALSLCDDKFKRLFSDHDIEMLGSKEAAPIDCIFAKVQEMNRLRPEDMEELVKNSANGQDESQPSNLPSSTVA